MQIRTWIASGLVLVGVATGSACGSSDDTPPPPSTTCAHNSDCQDGLLCVLGRCEAQCNKDRDCPSGARCLETKSGSACVTPESASCSLGSCPEGTICAIDGQCRTSCDPTAGLTCLEGQACVGAVCVGMDASHDAGASSALGAGGGGGSGGHGGGAAGSGASGHGGGGGTGGAHGGSAGSGASGQGGSSAGGTTAGQGGGGSGGAAGGAGGTPSGGSGGSTGGSGGTTTGGAGGATGGSGGDTTGGAGGIAGAGGQGGTSAGGAGAGGTGGTGGACTMGTADCDMTPGCETTLATDASNCGVCKRQCEKACSASVCEAVPYVDMLAGYNYLVTETDIFAMSVNALPPNAYKIADSPVAGSGATPFEPASGYDSGTPEPHGLTGDGTTLYWSVAGSPAGIFRKPYDGSSAKTLETITSAPAAHLTLHSGTFYFAGVSKSAMFDDDVIALPQGGAETTIAPAEGIIKRMVVAEGRLYWLRQAAALELRTAALPSGPVSTIMMPAGVNLAAAQGLSIATDGTSVYFNVARISALVDGVYRWTPGDGAATNLVIDEEIFDIAADGTDVYYYIGDVNNQRYELWRLGTPAPTLVSNKVMGSTIFGFTSKYVIVGTSALDIGPYSRILK